MPIPTRWNEEYVALVMRQRAQQQAGQEDPVVSDGEIEVEALLETPITSAELAELSDVRGQYRVGDTRGFVIRQEQDCTAWNCWMVREGGGSTHYLSEAPPPVPQSQPPLMPGATA